MTNKPQQCEHQGKKYINKESTLSHLQNGTEYGKMKKPEKSQDANKNRVYFWLYFWNHSPMWIYF